ncbi:hypothetical protein IFM89_002463 [Coptis chinensis]|uniref:CCAAT-binding factor domain-containing protein n=1 Tax=Coptis chinensis TaxID=261450 RepID=A0A835ILI4_9MAGN|nr:hypothetical protein IFM89_002463 [Coptis chinensis]
MSSILSKKYSLKDLKNLGHQLLSSKLHINNLPLLITFISPSSPPKHALESFISLHSFFTPVINHLPTSKSLVLSNNHDDDKDPELVYNIWLRSNFDEFLNSLFAVAVSPEADDTLREVALDGVMEFVKLGKGGKFQSMIYQRFLQAIVYSPSGIDVVVETLVSNFFNYIDVRYFTYITLEKLVRTLDSRDIKDTNNTHQDSENKSKLSNLEFAIHKIHYILSDIPPLETKEGQSDYQMWSELGLSSKETDGKQSKEGDQENRPKKSNSDYFAKLVALIVITHGCLARSFDIADCQKMKLKFTKAWLSFLRLSLPLDVYKEVLVTLHQIVIRFVKSDNAMPLHSHDTTWSRISNFYEKLYALLEPSIFMAKHRAKFFELLDSCLKSPLLPAYLAAAFTKKLSRLSLVVPPPGALVVIAIIHNLLRRHPSINFLVQQQNDETDGDSSRRENENSESVKESNACTDISTAKPGIDMFNSEETDPAKSNAMRSSLWEIDTLRHHYCPAVSRFVASLENDLTVRAKTTEITVKDFSSASYATIFRAEIGRRIKQVPLAFYKASPASLFLESDFPGWSFKLDDSENEESGNGNNGLLTKSVVADEKSTKRRRIEC